MDIKDIQNLIKFVSKAEVSEVKYKTKDFEITIKTPLAGSEMSYVQQPQFIILHLNKLRLQTLLFQLLLQQHLQNPLQTTANLLP